VGGGDEKQRQKAGAEAVRQEGGWTRDGKPNLGEAEETDQKPPESRMRGTGKPRGTGESAISKRKTTDRLGAGEGAMGPRIGSRDVRMTLVQGGEEAPRRVVSSVECAGAGRDQ